MNTPVSHTPKHVTNDRRREEDLAAALVVASLSGYDEITKFLQGGKRQEAFYRAAEKGYPEIVELLLPYVDPKAWDSVALRNAAYNGYIDIVRLLIPVSDPTAVAMLEDAIAAQNNEPSQQEPGGLAP